MSQTDESVRDTRWRALIVLCAGMLMIILDGTIVTVALPSIQSDLGFSQSSLAWVVNAYLIAFGGLLLLAGRLGDLIGRRADVPQRPGRVHGGLAAVRAGRQPGDADRRALRPGRGRGDGLGGDPRHDRHDVPRAARAGEGDRRLQLRGLGRRLDRPARRRRAHAGDQLALDLLRQHPDRHRHGGAGRAADRRRARDRAPRGRRRAGRRADHRIADAARVHDRRRGRQRLGLGPDARPRARSRSCCWSRSSCARRPRPSR